MGETSIEVITPPATPFGLPRGVILGIYMVMIFFTGCTYWGWDGVQGLFYRSGAYEWTCDASSTERLVIGGVSYVNCDERKAGINNMYTVAFTSFLIGSALGGTLMDALGEKVAALTGQTLAATGWLLWSFSSESFPAYYPGAILIGMASDPGYLPLLTVRQLFPENTSFVMGITGSTRSLSFTVPIFMNQIAIGLDLAPENVWVLGKVYVGVIMVCVIVATILFLPMHGFPEAAAPATDTTVELQPPGKQVSHTLEHDATLAAPGAGEKGFDAQTVLSEDADDITFGDILRRRRVYVAICIVMTLMIRAEFFTKSNKDQLVVGEENAYALFSIMNVMSFAPGPLMGWIADKYTINMTQTIINAACIVEYAVVCIPAMWAKYAACIMVLIVNSFVLSALYCFVKDYFPKRHFGKVVGICDLAGGMFGLLSIPIYQVGVSYGSFVPPNLLMIAFGCLCAVLIVFQWRETEYSSKAKQPHQPPSSMKTQV